MHKEMKSIRKKNWGWGESLVLQKPNWQILRLTLILLVFFFLFGEWFFRIDAVQAGLTGMRIGSRHRQFEIQVARLDKLVREGTPIDCIFLGNSMMWLGVDPLIVSRTFEEKTGEEIHCFNFGVSALPASSAGEIATMLVDKYHPKILIYGIFARDYAVPASAEDAYVISDTLWLKYRNGNFNMVGWLYDKSSIFQYKGHIRDLLYMHYLEDVLVQKNDPPYKAYGLDPKYDVRLDVRISPDFESDHNRDPVKWLTNFQTRNENLNGLQTIVNQSNKDVHVIILEMPFYETALEFFGNGEQDYSSYIQPVDAITASGKVPFWRLSEQPPLAPKVWWDYLHLNLKGARLFSEWLGDKLADTYRSGDLGLSLSDVP